MNDHRSNARITLLLFSLVLISGCAGVDGRDRASDEQLTNEARPNAQTAEPDTSQLAEYVVEAFEDSKGNLWFGTMEYGAARYDGKTLTYFTEKDGLCGNTIPSFAEDKEGNLWFGSHTGVCKYNGANFTRYRDGEGGVRAGSDGTIWVGSSTGVAYYNGSAIIDFDVPVDVKAIKSYSITPGRVSMKLQDSKGHLWFAADGAGVFRYDGTSFTHFTKKDGLCSNTVNGIVEDKQGRLWFICMQSHQPAKTGDGGLCRYDPSAAPGTGTKTFTTFPEVDGLHGNDLYSILADRAGNIWIGATGLGVYRYDGAFTLFNTTDRKTTFGVQDILEDRNGTMWFGFSGGLFRLEGSAIVNVTKGGPW